MGLYPDRGDAQVRPRRLLFLFPSQRQLVVTAILVKAQLCLSCGCLLLSSVGLRFGDSGSVAGIPRREEAYQQGNNGDQQGNSGDDRAEFHERTVCLSAKRPAAMSSSPRRAEPANQLPATTPATSVRRSSRPCAISRR